MSIIEFEVSDSGSTWRQLTSGHVELHREAREVHQANGSLRATNKAASRFYTLKIVSGSREMSNKQAMLT